MGNKRGRINDVEGGFMRIIFNKPVNGDLIDINKLPDKVFSEKMLGDTIAYKPKKGVVYSPIDGEITMLFPTGHALGLKHESGLEILIHIGINSVNLNGSGFKSLVKINDKVKKGEELITFDLALLAKENINDSVIVILTSGGKFHNDILRRTVIDYE